MKALYSVAAAMAACFAIQTPAAAAVTFLSSSAALSCPDSGCFTAPGRLTRVFSAEHFSGPTWIESFVLDKKMLGKLAGETFKLTFWNADGQQIGDFQSFNLSVLGDVVTLRGNGFEFDPSKGPLLVRLDFRPRSDAGEDLLAAMGFSRPVLGGFGGGGGGGGGFAAAAPAGPGFGAPTEETHFLPVSIANQPFLVDVTPLPEPAVWAEMVLGFMALGGLVRSRRRAPARA